MGKRHVFAILLGCQHCLFFFRGTARHGEARRGTTRHRSSAFGIVTRLPLRRRARRKTMESDQFIPYCCFFILNTVNTEFVGGRFTRERASLSWGNANHTPTGLFCAHHFFDRSSFFGLLTTNLKTLLVTGHCPHDDDTQWRIISYQMVEDKLRTTKPLLQFACLLRLQCERYQHSVAFPS